MMSRASTPVRANIVLTGFMGTGKSTVGHLVADRLGLAFVDTDAEIERRHGPIPEIFADHGEAHFRRLEADLVDSLVARAEPAVVATGGGLMIDPDNATRLSATGLVYTLTAEADEIVRRVTGAGASYRPLLAGPDAAERVRRLLAERAEAYARFTPIATDGRTPEAIADEIVAHATGLGPAGRAARGRSPLLTALLVLVALLVVVVLAALIV